MKTVDMDGICSFVCGQYQATISGMARDGATHDLGEPS